MRAYRARAASQPREKVRVSKSGYERFYWVTTWISSITTAERDLDWTKIIATLSAEERKAYAENCVTARRALRKLEAALTPQDAH